MQRLSIAVDIDGVVADFSSAANQWLSEHTKSPLIECDRWDWYSQYPDGLLAWDLFWRDAVQRDGILRYLPQIEKAHCCIQYLQQRGHVVEFVTHRRPMGAIPTDTIMWFMKNGFGVPVVHYEYDKHSLGFDVLIDDKPMNVRKHENKEQHGFLFSQPWNRDERKLPRVDGWEHFVAEVHKLDH